MKNNFANVGLPALYPNQERNVDTIAKPKERAEWVDIAKAVSIILVVLWHSAGVDWLPNRLAFFIRMPLFFCVAGFFAAGAIHSSWRKLLSTKVAHFVYLYVVWLTVSFLLTSMAYALVQGHSPNFLPYLRDFYRPALTLWFLYALAIMFPLAKIFSGLPVYFLIPMLIALYVLSATSGEWTWGSFPDRIARLSLMFAVGALGYKQISRISARHRAWWPGALALYGIGSYLVFAYDLMDLPYVALALNGLGVWSIILFAQAVANAPFSYLLKKIGQGTLFIYVLHRILLFYSDLAFDQLHLPESNLFQVLQAAMVIPIAFAFGGYLSRRAPWLFEAPWLTRGKPAINKPIAA